MAPKLIPFDMADYLDTEERIAEYLAQVRADGDEAELRRALDHVARARVKAGTPSTDASQRGADSVE